LKNESCAGFTLVESLVSLAIVSMIGVIIFMAFSVGVKSVTQSHSSVLAALRHLKTDTVLRNSLEKVRIPYWEKDFELSATATTLVVPWYGGAKEAHAIALPDGVKDITYELVKPVENGAPTGCRVKYRIDNREYSSAVVFASAPPGVLKP
jgi:prepilin-type N-terminal cleavage/methylation domain-containing protein